MYTTPLPLILDSSIYCMVYMHRMILNSRSICRNLKSNQDEAIIHIEIKTDKNCSQQTLKVHKDGHIYNFHFNGICQNYRVAHASY